MKALIAAVVIVAIFHLLIIFIGVQFQVQAINSLVLNYLGSGAEFIAAPLMVASVFLIIHHSPMLETSRMKDHAGRGVIFIIKYRTLLLIVAGSVMLIVFGHEGMIYSSCAVASSNHPAYFSTCLHAYLWL